MMTPEEERVVAYLRGRADVRVEELARACLPGAPPDWLGRVLANLDWLGYVVVYHGPDGEPGAVQLTDQALVAAGG